MPNKETIIEDRIQMSNEEAIYTLKNMAFLDVERDHAKTEEAIKTAISALEEIDRIKAERDFTDAVHTAIYTIDYIHQLLAERDKLLAERDKLKAERDAAIADLEAISECTQCKYYKKSSVCEDCNDDYSNFEWRGVTDD